MAALSTDYFQKVGDATVTTLAAPGKALAATSITVGSTTNYPTDTGVTIAIRVVDTDGALVAGTYTEWVGTITSGTTAAINGTPVYGSDQVYAAGSTTQVYIGLSKYAHNRLVDGLLIAHDQDGTLKAGAVDNAAVLASDVVTTAKILDANVTTAKIADASITNAKLSTSAGEIGAAWQNWTPTWTNLTLGNGTVVAKYLKVGKDVKAYLRLTLGSTTSLTASLVKFSFPVTPNTNIISANSNQYVNVGTALFGDVGVTVYHGCVLVGNNSTTDIVPIVFTAGGSYVQDSPIVNTIPHTWGNGDFMHFYFSYEAA